MLRRSPASAPRSLPPPESRTRTSWRPDCACTMHSHAWRVNMASHPGQDLKSYVDAQGRHGEDRDARVLRWLRRVYPGDIAGTVDRAKPAVAARMLADTPDLLQDDPYLACAIGDTDRLRWMTRSDPDWVNRAGGRLALPALVAVTHSSLVKLPAFRERLYSSARFLLEADADPNQSVGSRWTPASLGNPSEEYSLSALYGAYGQNHDPGLTKILLEAGADPNDNESSIIRWRTPTAPACCSKLARASKVRTRSIGCSISTVLRRFGSCSHMAPIRTNRHRARRHRIGDGHCSGRSGGGVRWRISRRCCGPAPIPRPERRTASARTRWPCNSD